MHQHFKKAGFCFSELLEDFHPESIHDFRVEIKKLRALVRLLNTEDTKTKGVKLGHHLKNCYHISGDIRNLQLHRFRIQDQCTALELPLPRSYLGLLSENESLAKARCRKAGSGLSFDVLEAHTLLFLPHQLRQITLQEFVEQKRKSLDTFLLRAVFSDEDLHSLRKELKDLLYCWIFIHSFADFLQAGFTSKERIEKLTSQLGDFFDYCMALQFLSDDYLVRVKEEEMSSCMVLKLSFEEKRNHLRQTILPLLYGKKNPGLRLIFKSSCQPVIL